MIEDVNKTLEDLRRKLYKVECKGWILGKTSGLGDSGNTLELELGKQYDNYSLPDFNGIELKVRSVYSNYPIHLFCATFDTKPNLIRELLNKGGYPSKENLNLRVFNTTVNAVSRKSIRALDYILNVDYDNQLLSLLIYVRNSNNIIRKMSWSFYELETRLKNKLNYLVIVNVLRDRKYEKKYYRYINPVFYKLKGFDDFLKLIEAGIITVTFKISYHHSGEKVGQLLDRGTCFDIDYNNIPMLFDEISIPLY